MDKTKIINKICKHIVSLEKKLEGVSGVYLTNTPKRQSEQRQRDKLKEQYRQRLELLIYFKDAAERHELSAFETALLTGTFYEEIITLSRQYQQNNETLSIDFHNMDEMLQKVLIKTGIKDTNDLCKALKQFAELQRKAVTPTDPNAKRLRDLIFTARNNQRDDIQFTPEPLAAHLISLAVITPESRVLEPEAGIASIADKAKEITPNVDCVEIMPLFREILELKGHNIVGSDLFKHEQNPIYDAVVMNPPFSEEIEHIKYAFGFLKPGGTLVAVCSLRFTFMDKRGYPEFRMWLKEHSHAYEKAGDRFEKTAMESVILRITRKADEYAA